MAIVKQISVRMKNERGVLAELCSEPARVAVNIKALMVPDQAGTAPVRMLVNNLATAQKVLEELGFHNTPRNR